MFRVHRPILAIAFCLNVGIANAGDKVQTVPATGLTINGSLSSDDPTVVAKPSDLRAKSYQVKLAGGKAYVIEMNSKQFDPYLVVQDADGKTIAEDDDGGGALNSRLLLTPAKDTVFKIHAAALTGVGSFVLKVKEAAAASDPKKVYDPAKAVVTLDGNITNENRVIFYQVKLEKGATYQIDLMSKMFDSFLTINDMDGKKIADDDDGGDGFNSRIVIEAESSGTYRIIASSLGMMGRGSFRLTIEKK